MAISRRAFNNILIYVSLGMLIIFQSPQWLKQQEQERQPPQLLQPLFTTPITRLQGQGWQLELRGEQWQSQPDISQPQALIAHWQQLQLLPLVNEADAAAALTQPEQSILVWLEGQQTPRTVRLVRSGDQLLIEADGRRGQLPLKSYQTLLPQQVRKAVPDA